MPPPSTGTTLKLARTTVMWLRRCGRPAAYCSRNHMIGPRLTRGSLHASSVSPSRRSTHDSASFHQQGAGAFFHSSSSTSSSSSSSSSSRPSSSLINGVSPTGRLEIIVGPMFAGKTSELLRRMDEARQCGSKVALIKSATDDRYAKDAVVTHDGVKQQCVALAKLMDFYQQENTLHGHVDIIGVDEAQFFPDLVKFCAKATKAGTRVVVAGLDGDFRGRPFGQTTALLPLCDDVSKLAAKCAVCGAPAFFTRRLADSEEQELVGGADIYEPACRLHHGMLDGGDDE